MHRPLLPRNELLLLGAHERMDDPFQLGQPLGCRNKPQRKLGPVDDPALGDARKGRFDRSHRFAAIEHMHHFVGIVHRHAEFPEHARSSRFSHSDGAGKPDDDHACLSISLMMICLSVSSTTGLSPNHFSNPGTA